MIYNIFYKCLLTFISGFMIIIISACSTVEETIFYEPVEESDLFGSWYLFTPLQKDGAAAKVTIHTDNTFVIDEKLSSIYGTWVFDGDKLVLSSKYSEIKILKSKRPEALVWNFDFMGKSKGDLYAYNKTIFRRHLSP